MIRIVTPEGLKNENLTVDKIECHRQTWREGREWLGYSKRPRPTDGLSLLCSGVRASYDAENGISFDATKGDVVYVPGGTVYRSVFRNCGHGVDMYTVNFRLRDESGQSVQLSEQMALYAGAASPLCLELVSELADAVLFSDNRLKQQILLLRLLYELSAQHRKGSAAYLAVCKGVALLHEEWNKNERIARYAEACGISESGFYASFKEWAGVSPVEYRNRIRINAARSMLENTSLQISEIAFAIGFEDAYYFSRIFKKLTGTSPRAFRNR